MLGSDVETVSRLRGQSGNQGLVRLVGQLNLIVVVVAKEVMKSRFE
jgi:hypothetical protein